MVPIQVGEQCTDGVDHAALPCAGFPEYTHEELWAVLANSEGALCDDAECERLPLVESESLHDRLQMGVDVAVIREEDTRLTIDRSDKPGGIQMTGMNFDQLNIPYHVFG